jgi:hypothetical protein
MDFDLQDIEGQKSLVSEKHRRKTVLFFRPDFGLRSGAGWPEALEKPRPLW